MQYNERLSTYNQRLRSIVTEVSNLNAAESCISFKDQAEKDIHIDCDAPQKIVVTACSAKNGKIEQLPAALTLGVTESAIAFCKDKIWLFGGWTKNATKTQLCNSISYYDLCTNTIQESKATLPVDTSGIVALTYKDNIYLFGGYTSAGSIATISKFDPETETYSSLGISLPTSLVSGKVILDEANGIAYLVSGDCQTSQGMSDIYKVDLETLTVETLSVSLPLGVFYAAGAVCGSYLYIFGGKTDKDTYSNAIQWFDYETQQTGILDLTLPLNMYAAQAEFVNDKFYLFGGYNDDPTVDSAAKVFVIDLIENLIEELPQKLPWNLVHQALVTIDDTIYCFGGAGKSSYLNKECFAYTPYTQDTCVILLDPAVNTTSLLKTSSDSIDLRGNISNIYKISNNVCTEVSWNEKGIPATPTQVKYQFNMGAVDKEIRGYLRSSAFDSEPAFISIGAQGDYLETSAQLSGTYLPKAGTDQCAVAYGDYIYIFGAWQPVEGNSNGEVINRINRYTISTNTMETLTATLPHTISGCVGAVVRDKIYLIGGYSNTNGGATNLIMEFDPETETASISSYVLPQVRLNAACAVWGDDVYIVGGRHFDAMSSIVHFNPVKGIMTTLEATLPQAVFYSGWAQDDSKLYILGGRPDNSAHTTVIQYFDHITQTTGTLFSTPVTTQGSSGMVIDNYLHIIGGRSLNSTSKQLFWYKYNLLTGELQDLGFKLGQAPILSGFVTVGNTLYSFGGQLHTATSSYFTANGYKYDAKLVVPYNSLFLHTSSKGQLCIPYKVNGVEIEVQVDAIYKGNTDKLGQPINDVTTYYNNNWLPVC